MIEHVLSLNAFNMPKVFEASDTNYILIVRLLLLEPGKIVSHPTMGVGIRSRYRYKDENDIIALQDDIKNQIEMYLPELIMTNISLKIRDNILGVIIDTQSGTYAVAYNSETQQIDTGATYVLEDL